ncbi:MAG: hypothetical protein KU37_09460 [Sulfuricurvum sp. PC08-66]|nr:MAG: hypothetical protein KU37_09460 [Sulfuricurvum sp. PC08-66]
MRTLFFTLFLSSGLLWSSAITQESESNQSSWESVESNSTFSIPLLDAIHSVVSLEARYNYEIFGIDSQMLMVDDGSPKNPEFTLLNRHDFTYASAQLTLFSIFSIEQSLGAQQRFRQDPQNSFDYYALNLVLYNYDHQRYGSSLYSYERNFNGIFYGLFGWEETIQTIKSDSFLRGNSADTLTIRSNHSGTFLSKMWPNMINMLSILSHGNGAAAIASELDKMPITFWNFTFVPMVSFDLYTIDATYDYTKDGVTTYSEKASGGAWNVGVGFYLFSYDLLRSHYFNLSLFSSLAYISGQELYQFKSGSLNGQSYYNNTHDIHAKGFASISF